MEENQEPTQESSSLAVEETDQTIESNQNEAQAANDTQRNMAALREGRKKAERERDEYLQRIKQMEELQKQQKSAQPQRDPSDLAELRDLEDMRKQNEQQQAEYRRELGELRLRNKYSDIDQVLSAENIDKLKESDPDLAQIIADMPDDNKKAVAAYKYIKKMGIHADKNYDKEKEVIAANAAKPRSSSSASGKGTPLSEMNDFIDNPEDHRKRLYKEMVAASENR